jgi:hypothetical protein
MIELSCTDPFPNFLQSADSPTWCSRLLVQGRSPPRHQHEFLDSHLMRRFSVRYVMMASAFFPWSRSFFFFFSFSDDKFCAMYTVYLVLYCVVHLFFSLDSHEGHWFCYECIMNCLQAQQICPIPRHTLSLQRDSDACLDWTRDRIPLARVDDVNIPAIFKGASMERAPLYKVNGNYWAVTFETN